VAPNRETIAALAPATFLDLGCAEGYFVQEAAKSFGCVAIGVDADIRRLTVARTTSSLIRLTALLSSVRASI